MFEWRVAFSKRKGRFRNEFVVEEAKRKLKKRRKTIKERVVN